MCRWMYVHFKLISKIFLTLEDALACWSSCRSRIFTCKLAEYTRSSSFIISSKISFSTWCTTSETKFKLLSGWGAPVVDTNRNSSLSFNLNSEKEKTEYNIVFYLIWTMTQERRRVNKNSRRKPRPHTSW